MQSEMHVSTKTLDKAKLRLPFVSKEHLLGLVELHVSDDAEVVSPKHARSFCAYHIGISVLAHFLSRFKGAPAVQRVYPHTSHSARDMRQNSMIQGWACYNVCYSGKNQ